MVPVESHRFGGRKPEKAMHQNGQQDSETKASKQVFPHIGPLNRHSPNSTAWLTILRMFDLESN
jgi:hypothetical protein